MLPRKELQDFTPLKCHSLGFRVFFGQDIGQVSRLRFGKYTSILKSYPFFKSLTVLHKTVETGTDPHLTQHKHKKVCQTLVQQTRHFAFGEGRGLVISMLLWCHHNCYHNVQFSQNNDPAKFQPCRQIFHILQFYIILCPSSDVTSHLISKNQNLEQLGNQECYYNKINAILYHFESYSL